MERYWYIFTESKPLYQIHYLKILNNIIPRDEYTLGKLYFRQRLKAFPFI